MSDLGRYKVPREVELGREVRMEQRRSANRTALFGILGVLVLCVCMSLGICGLAYGMQLGPFSPDGQFSFNLGAPPTPTRIVSSSRTPTAVPYGRPGRNDAGLRVTISSYQRPLAAEDIEIPNGQELVLVTVKLENSRTTGGPIKYSPENFALVSPEGDRFEPTIGGITTGENLQAGEIAPGETARGDLVFYIYSDIPDLELAWTSADGKTRLFQLTR